jgi:hypothetical protein
VRYLSERRQPSGQMREVAFEDPAVLEDSPTLRLEILLEVGPGGVWDPPWVDSIQVRWDPLGGR